MYCPRSFFHVAYWSYRESEINEMRTGVLILLPAFWLAQLVPVQAGTHGWCGMDLQGEPGFRSNAQVFALDDTMKWLHTLERELPKRPGFDNINAALMRKFAECQKMECTLRVG